MSSPFLLALLSYCTCGGQPGLQSPSGAGTCLLQSQSRASRMVSRLNVLRRHALAAWLFSVFDPGLLRDSATATSVVGAGSEPLNTTVCYAGLSCDMRCSSIP